MSKPNRRLILRAGLDYSHDFIFAAELSMQVCMGSERARQAAYDAEREVHATRVWFAHRAGGWSPIDVVLRSSLYETETWYEPRGSAA